MEGTEGDRSCCRFDGHFESSNHLGWTAGAGVEYGLASGWTLGLEYNHYDLGTASYGGLAFATVVHYKIHLTADTAIAKLNDKFN